MKYKETSIIEPLSIVDLNLKNKDIVKVEPNGPEVIEAIEKKLKELSSKK